GADKERGSGCDEQNVLGAKNALAHGNLPALPCPSSYPYPAAGEAAPAATPAAGVASGPSGSPAPPPPPEPAPEPPPLEPPAPEPPPGPPSGSRPPPPPRRIRLATRSSNARPTVALTAGRVFAVTRTVTPFTFTPAP